MSGSQKAAIAAKIKALQKQVDEKNNVLQDCVREKPSVSVPVTVSMQKAIIASAGEPIIFRPTILNGEVYFDGGLRDIVPVEAAFDASAEVVYAILASTDVQSEPSSGKHMFEFLGRTIDISTNEIRLDDIKLPRARGKPVIVIQPTVDVHSGLTIDPGLIDISIDYGFMRAYDVIDGSSSSKLMSLSLSLSLSLMTLLL